MRAAKLRSIVVWALSFLFQQALCYRIGDSVHTVLLERSEVIDVTQAQRPSFGVATTVTLPRPNSRFSLGFEESLHALPWVDGSSIERLDVTFVYSRSGEGMIHYVSGKAPSGSTDESSNDIKIGYTWIEEEILDLQAGAIVMFTAMLLISVAFVIHLCGFSELGEDVSDADDGYGDEYDAIQNSGHRWDHHND